MGYGLAAFVGTTEGKRQAYSVGRYPVGDECITLKTIASHLTIFRISSCMLSACGVLGTSQLACLALSPRRCPGKATRFPTSPPLTLAFKVLSHTSTTWQSSFSVYLHHVMKQHLVVAVTAPRLTFHSHPISPTQDPHKLRKTPQAFLQPRTPCSAHRRMSAHLCLETRTYPPIVEPCHWMFGDDLCWILPFESHAQHVVRR